MIKGSIISYKDRGHWGNNRYRGNTSGHVIKDLINFFFPDSPPRLFLEVFSGGGTGQDVAKEHGRRKIKKEKGDSSFLSYCLLLLKIIRKGKVVMYFIKIGAKGLDYEAVIVKIDHRNDIHKRLREFCKHINCDLISIANLTSNVDAVVDDVGFLVSKNPVFEIKLRNSKANSHTLAGTILVGETIMTCEGKDVVGFETYEKANDFLKQLDISLVGQTY